MSELAVPMGASCPAGPAGWTDGTQAGAWSPVSGIAAVAATLAGPLGRAVEHLRRGGTRADALTVAGAETITDVARLGRPPFPTAVGAPMPERLVMLDDASLVRLAHPGFPFSHSEVADLHGHVVHELRSDPDGPIRAGIRCDGRTEWQVLAAADPDVIGVTTRAIDDRHARTLAGHLDAGGVVAWGAVPTDGPIGSGDRRWWGELAGLWCGLAQAGCDPLALRTQALITPAGDLARHTPHQAAAVRRITEQLGERVRHQALATRLTVGA